MSLQNVAEMLRRKYHATVHASPNYLEVEMIAPIPKTLLRIEFKVLQEAGPGEWKMFERELGQLEWREKTRDYEWDPDVLNVIKEIRDDIESLWSRSR